MFEKVKKFVRLTIPHRGRSIWYKLRHNTHKRRIFVSVASMYVIIAGLIGFALIQDSGENSSAYYPANLVAALKQEDNASGKVGSTINFDLTLQNSSPNETINNIELRLLSSKQAIEWHSIDNNNSSKSTPLDSEIINLEYLSAGERATYTLHGTILNKNIESISTLGKLTYVTPAGLQSTETNREFLPLTTQASLGNANHLSLGSDAQTYTEGQPVVLTLSKNGVVNDKIEGKVVVTNLDTLDTVTGENCNLSSETTCTINVSNLRSGSYSAMFSDKTNTLVSQISQFSVSGTANNFVPEEDAKLVTPLGPTSINGVTVVYAQNVIPKSSPVTASQKCDFVVSRAGETDIVIPTIVNQERDCVLQLNSSQVPKEGIYNIRLNGTTKSVNVSIVNRTSGLLTLSNDTLVLAKGKPVNLSIKNINDKYNTPLENTKAALSLLHYNSGIAEEIQAINGASLIVKNGILDLPLSAQYFEKGGVYHAFVRLENGQQSETLTLNFSDNKAGLTTSGVIVDNYNSLKIGEPINVKVTGVRDQNSNPIESGSCGLEVYTSANPVEPLFVNGIIAASSCSATIDGSLITTAGPVLVTLEGDTIDRDIQQSRQLYIQPGNLSSFGTLNLEYEPARVDFANNAILGPITDVYGNLTSADKLTLAVIKKDKVVYQLDNLSTSNGFIQTVIPSSIFKGMEGDSLFFKIINGYNGQEVLNKRVTIVEEDQRLILPYIPDEIKSDENIKAEYGGLGVIDDFPCSLQYIRSDLDTTFASSTYTTATDSCEFDYELKQFRNNEYGLIKLTAGNRVFHKVVHNISSDASNLFVLTPEVRVDNQDELQLKLHTSPLVDIQGLPVKSGEVKLEYNGKVIQNKISDGFSNFELPVSLFDNSDLKEIGDDKFLDLNLNAKAGVLSIAKTNDLEIFLDDNDIADKLDVIESVHTKNIYTAERGEVLSFASSYCNAITIGGDSAIQKTASHYQDETCYIETSSAPGKYRIVFEERGYRVAEYLYEVVDYETPQVRWCTNSPCKIKVDGALTSQIEAIIYDNKDEYRFNTEEVSNELQLKQNGLNPLKNYPVTITFKDAKGAEHKISNQVSGELLIK